MKCNQGSAAPYYTQDCKVYFPVTLTSIDNVHMYMASNTIGWVQDITGKTVIDCRNFKIMGMTNENDYVYKQVYINVKGRWK